MTAFAAAEAAYSFLADYRLAYLSSYRDYYYFPFAAYHSYSSCPSFEFVEAVSYPVVSLNYLAALGSFVTVASSYSIVQYVFVVVAAAVVSDDSPALSVSSLF